MKKIAKLFSLALISLVAFGISSCTDKYEYEAANVPANQVYFDKDNATIDVDKNAGAFDINVYRVDTKEETTVPVTFTPDEGNVYTVPANVTFAKGQSVAPLHITFNSETLEYGKYTGGTISIAGEGIDTTYGISSLTFKAGATEWVPFEENKSYGTYREDLLTTFYSVENLSYNVYMEKSIVRPGVYRMVNAYGKSYPYNEDGDYDATKDYYWEIDASDPNAVYFTTYNSGMNWGYGEFIFGSLVSYYLDKGVSLDDIKAKLPELFGTLKNGVITMPASGMFIIMSEYNPTQPQTANNNGMLAVALPGAKLADYSASASYAGRLSDVNDNDFALVDFTLGSDVASIKYALVKAEAGTPNEILGGIMSGAIESQEVTESGQVRIPYIGSGKYYLVYVAYDENGEAQSADAIILNLRSNNEVVEQWNDVAAGVLTIGAVDLSEVFFGQVVGCVTGSEPIVSEAILQQSSLDATKFRIDPYIFDGFPLYFTVLENGQIIEDQVESGFVNKNKNPIFITDTYTYFKDYKKNEESAGQVYDKNLHSFYSAEKDTYYFQYFFCDDGGVYGVQRDIFEVAERADAKAIAKSMSKARKAAAQKKSNVINRNPLRMFMGGIKVK